MNHPKPTNITPANTALSCLRDGKAVLECIMSLYFDAAQDIDSRTNGTAEAKRYLDGYDYISQSIHTAFGMLADAEAALENL